MKLVKTSLYSGLIIAVIIGPSGVALVGQLGNFITMASTIASGAINGGVVSLTAKYHDNEQLKHRVWQTAVWISSGLSIITAIAVITFRNFLSIAFLHDPQYSGVFLAFGCSIVLFVWNQLLLAILNGQGEIGKLTIINAINSFASLGISIILVVHYQVYGALLAITLIPNLIFFFSLIFVYKTSWFRWRSFIGKIDKDTLKSLFGYTVIVIIGATVTPLQQLLIRNLMIDKINLTMAGNWQGLQKISDAYLMIVYTAFSTYFMPKFSSLKTTAEIKTELLSCYKLIIPFVASTIIVIYFGRNLIVHLLYSKAFMDMGQLFFWQLTGDFFKTIAWPMGLIFVSKGNARIIGMNDIIFNGALVILSYILIQFMAIQATVFAFAITYFLWFIWLTILTRKYLND